MKFHCAILLAMCSIAMGEDMAQWVADRAAVERVYYNHRVGIKAPFEQILPEAVIKRLVQQDWRKAEVLHRIYHVDVTAAEINAEVARINATTRAPQVLAELRAALGNDPQRFAWTVARPIVIERELREHFEKDDRIDATLRREAEAARGAVSGARQQGALEQVALLQHSYSNKVALLTWRLGPPSQDSAAKASNEVDFNDLPGPLQKTLRAQLHRAGDISAVIETPREFLLCVAISKTEETLSVAALSLPKRSYAEWLDEVSTSSGAPANP